LARKDRDILGFDASGGRHFSALNFLWYDMLPTKRQRGLALINGAHLAAHQLPVPIPSFPIEQQQIGIRFFGGEYHNEFKVLK
jgi:hypothetical protein